MSYRLCAFVTLSFALASAACGDDKTPGKEVKSDATDTSDGTVLPDATDSLETTGTPEVTTAPDVPDGTEVSPETSDTSDTHDTEVITPPGCGDEIPAPPAGQLCGIEAGNSNALLIRADIILPNGIQESGQLLILDGFVACAGCDCAELATAQGATVFNCPDAVVSPGLINAHDHITYTQGKPIGHGTTRYDHRNEWRNGDNGKPEIPYDDNPDDNGQAFGELRQVMAGTTSLFGAGPGQAGLLRNLDVNGKLEGLQHGTASSSIFPLGSKGIYDSGCTKYDLPNENVAQGKIAYVPHVGEGVSLGSRNEMICLDGQDPTGVDIVADNVAFIHGMGATAADIALFVGAGGSLVWSPRSNTDLYGFTAEAPLYHKLGGIIGLGTDWTFSGSVNILRELQCAEDWNARWDNYFSDQQLVNMVTS